MTVQEPTIYETAREHINLTEVRFTGRVLDVGGGGEGIIGRVGGASVVSIDLREEELREAPGDALRIVMDACAMRFLEDSFDHVAFFYTLMYMDANQVGRALCEARRVLKPDGQLWIWDAVIPDAIEAEAFVAQIEITMPDGSVVTPGYGVRWTLGQSAEGIAAMCREAGFDIRHLSQSGEAFQIICRT